MPVKRDRMPAKIFADVQICRSVAHPRRSCAHAACRARKLRRRGPNMSVDIPLTKYTLRDDLTLIVN